MLEGLIRSKTARKILSILVANPEEKYYVRQLERLTREPVSAVQRELRKFYTSGILSSREEARVTYYWINKSNPIYEDIKNIILKTQGASDHVRSGATRKAPTDAALIEQYESKIKDFARGHQEILAAYLFGSLVEGTANKLSDIDIAILIDKTKVHESTHPYGYKASVIAELIKLLKTNDIDIVLLNSAPPLLAQRIYVKGRLLYSRNDRARVANRVNALNRYLDLKLLQNRCNGGRYG